MRRFFLAVLVVAFGAVALAGVGPVPTPQSNGSEGWKAQRTPWGDPDLQGIWSGGYVNTQMERPKQHEGRPFLTEEEVKAEIARIREGEDHSVGGTKSTAAQKGDTGGYNTVFSGRGRDVIRTRRTSYVIDPPDGQIPYKPERQEKARQERKNTRTGVLSNVLEDNERGGDGPEDRPNDRCRGFALPHQFAHAEAGGSHHRIVQSPGLVSIYYEYGPHGGAYRDIPVGNRPHLPSNVRQWLGDPVARWEGETLVVDTTNFTDQTNYYGAGENMHLTERFTRTAPDLIIYRATIEDSTTFTRPWTIEVPLSLKDGKANQIYETPCHEGNYALTGILAGARAYDKEQAAKEAAKKKGSR
jgi:hypothetical protein